MKKTITIVLALLAAAGTYAEKKGAIILKSPAYCQMLNVSQNGQWAVGVQMDEEYNYTGNLRWNLLTGKLDNIGGLSIGGVTNSGDVVGTVSTDTGEEAAVWSNGKWTALEATRKGVWTTGITPDGQYVVGTDDTYKAYIWKNGSIEHRIKINPIGEGAKGYFVASAISPDGRLAGGWAYYNDNNRNAGYWSADDSEFHWLLPTEVGTMWQGVKKFSADSKKVLMWGGWSIDPKTPEKGRGVRSLYNIETNDTIYFYPTSQDPDNFEFYDMNDDGSFAVGMQQDNDGNEWAVVWHDGVTEFAEDYLTRLGVTFTDEEVTSIDDRRVLARTMSVSGDAKTIILNYYNADFEFCSMAVCLDRDVEKTAPVCFEAAPVEGLKAVQLSWSEPLGEKHDLLGYNIYRNGSKVNQDVFTETTYYDKPDDFGEYTYSVTALYEEGESVHSDSVAVKVAEKGLNKPSGLFARQKGYDATYINWEAPESNLLGCSYVDGTGSFEGFGGNEFSFETAVLFPANRMNVYSDDYLLTAVSFYPMEEQGSWLVNIYTHNNGRLQILKSYPVIQELEYGRKNVFYLPQQLAIMPDHDLIVGIQTNVTNPSANVQGMYYGPVTVGRTDLVRMVGEADFYSLNEASQSGAYPVTWATSALFAKEGVTSDVDVVDHYNLYVDGNKVDETKLQSYVDAESSLGSHEFSVEAAYATGLVSDTTKVAYERRNDTSALKSIVPVVVVDDECPKVTATWQAPVDDDAVALGYCTDTPGKKSPKTTDDVTEFLARVDFTPLELKGYGDYEVRSISFYPLSEVTMAVLLYENAEEVFAVEEVKNLVPGEWNRVVLPSPVKVADGNTYRVIVDAYNCPSGVQPLATDNKTYQNDYCDLYTVPGAEEWESITEFSASGNWMIRLNIADPSVYKPFDVKDYDLYIDGIKKQTGITDTAASYEFSEADEDRHYLRVDANYNEGGKTVRGETVGYLLGVYGIDDLTGEDLQIRKDSRIFNVLGQEISARKPNSLSIFRTTKGARKVLR